LDCFLSRSKNGGRRVLPPESLILAGYYGFGNAGDELILHSLIQSFRKDNPEIEITVFSKTPMETRRHFDVQAVDRWRPASWISPLFHASHFILGGGGLLQEETGPWNHFYYLSLLMAAKMFGCQTEVTALGVDPVRGAFNRFWTRFILNHFVDVISVRDETSREALLEAGVTMPVSLRADPVRDLNVERSARSSNRIALALSPSKIRPNWDREIAQLCDHLAAQLDASIDLLAFFPAEDEKFERAIARQSAGVRSVRVWEKPIDLLSWMPQYQLVVATRFHALILASGSQIPFVGWGPQKKVEALCRELGKPYTNTDEIWNEDDQLNQIASLYQSARESVILATRTD
jgi:polysaccharide pyruvyl transferase CsaB